MKPQQTKSPFDLDKIKKQARESIKEGAVTKDYPLDIEQACKLLNDALATEIMCVMRYRHHQIIARGIEKLEVAAEFEEHAVDEQRHMLMIAERINQLGGNPDFNPGTVLSRTATEYGSQHTDLPTLIKEDLIAERIAIMVYRELIEWFEADVTTRRMLEEILEDEEDHASDLADLM